MSEKDDQRIRDCAYGVQSDSRSRDASMLLDEVDALRRLPVIATCGDCAHLDCGMGGAYCVRLPPGSRRDVPPNPIPGPVGYGTPPPPWCPLRGAP